MNIKRAIELLEIEYGYHYKFSLNCPVNANEEDYAKEIEEVSVLLKELNNYKKMWEELYQEFVKNQKETNISGYSYMIDMNNLKEKYFPLPKTTREKINDIINEVINIDEAESPSLSRRNNIIALLVSLRDSLEPYVSKK